MAGAKMNPDAEVFLKQIEEAESQAKRYGEYIKKLKSRLSRSKRALATKPAVTSQVSALISDLESFQPDPASPSVVELRRSLEDDLKKLQRRFQESFPDDLRKACENAKLAFTGLPDGFGIGPFHVTLNTSKETASFEFAKLDMGNDVPMNVSAIVDQVTFFRESLIDQPVDLTKFSSNLNEAMRVALARQGNIPKTDWRVELPLVFRELAFIRQSHGTRRKTSQAEYSLCRFVVELKQFIQSDENMRADDQYRLETAVLENTKNRKKSIFIPKDVSRSFGEGTYYQTILLRHV